MTTKQEIFNILVAHEKRFTKFKKTIENKNVILLIGLTRSGKSTLGNYLIRNQLRSVQERRKVFKIECEEPPGQGPDIGQGSSSVTKIPGVYILSDDTVIVDAPGFEDNRGDAQDILNSVFIGQIKFVKTVKFILVSDIADITNDNIGNFLSTLRQLYRFVTNLTEKIGSFAVVFTKDSKMYTQVEIAELFANKILNNKELDADRELVENFVNNQQLIGIFRMPTKLGVITHDSLTINVNNAIHSCVAVAPGECKIQVALSDVSYNIVGEICTEYAETTFFEPYIKKVINNKYINYFDVDDYVFASYDGELRDTENTMFDIVAKLEKESSKIFSFIYEIADSLSRIYPETNQNTESQKRFALILCLDKFAIIPQRLKEIIIHNYIITLGGLKTKINSLINEINKEQATRTSQKIVFGGFIGIATFLATTGAAGAWALTSTIAALSIFGIGIIGSIICLGSAVVFYKRSYGVRYEARKKQGRAL